MKTLRLTAAVVATLFVAGAAFAQNLPPDVDPGGPYSGVVGQPVQFDASGTTDPEQDTLTYLWDFGDGSTPPFPTQQPMASHAYTEPGTYTAQLGVTDAVNDPILVSVTVEITDAPPLPEGDNWAVRIPFLLSEFTVTLDPFGSFLCVYVTYPDNTQSVAIGMEFDGIIFWMDVEGAIFFGNINRDTGSMSGIVFGHQDGSGVWFGERLSE